MVKLVNTFIGLIFFISSGFSGTIIPEGDVSGEWNASGNPYLITGNISIQSDQHLTINPGVNVIFQDSYFFQVIGQLTAIGNSNDSIYFTFHDTTGYATGEHNGWHGLTFNGNTPTQMPESIVDYCNFEYSLGNGIACLNFSDLTISNSTFRKNKLFGVELYSFSNISMNNLLVIENKEGGLSINNSTIELSDFIIRNNSGSGISLSGTSNIGGKSTIYNGLISNNTAPYYGGGLKVINEASMTCRNLEIKENSATIGGGGIYLGVASGRFSEVNIFNNNADLGGGLFADAYSDFNINHSIIAANMANTHGGGLYLLDTYLNVTNVTIADNVAGNSGGGIFSRILVDWFPLIENTIIWDNSPESISTEGFMPSVRYSDVQGGFEGQKNIDVAPLFVNSNTFNYNLQWINYPQSGSGKSACIDAGNPLSTPDPDGTTKDMGALAFDQGYITSIESSFTTEITVYPNPAENTIFIDGITNFEHLTISNLSGAVVEQSNLSNNLAQMDVTNLKPGLYILRFSKEDGKHITKKFIKK